MNPVTPIRSQNPFETARQMRGANKAIAPALPSYFVVMIDYGRGGCEAIVDPEVTRREVVSRIVSGEYRDIRFIQEVVNGVATDVTLELQIAASAAAVGNHVREAFAIFNEWCDALGKDNAGAPDAAIEAHDEVLRAG